MLCSTSPLTMKSSGAPKSTVYPPNISLLRAPLASVTMRRRHSIAPETMAPPMCPPPNSRLLTRNRRSFVFSSSINGNNAVSSQNAQLVAIDSKIEQAMDLVKTHLIFAVREEVELLRSKILDLETTVVQLEAENSILREHVPSEILENLTLQPGANKVTSTTLMSTQ